MTAPGLLPPASVADARTYSAAALAATGLVLWALQVYVFRGRVPSDVTADVYVIVPAVAGYLASHLTRRHTLLAQAASTRAPEAP